MKWRFADAMKDPQCSWETQSLNVHGESSISELLCKMNYAVGHLGILMRVSIYKAVVVMEGLSKLTEFP